MFFLTGKSVGQNNLSLNWVEAFDSAAVDILDARFDKNENLTIIGFFTGEVDFDFSKETYILKSLQTKQRTQIFDRFTEKGDYLQSFFIARYDKHRKLLSAKNFYKGMLGNATAALDEDGSVYFYCPPGNEYINSNYNNYYPVIPGFTDDTGEVFILIKLNERNELVYTKKYTSVTQLQKFVIDKTGALIELGIFTKDIELKGIYKNKILTYSSKKNTISSYIAKYDAQGELVFASEFNPSGDHTTSLNKSTNLLTDHSGNIILSGSINGSINIGLGKSRKNIKGKEQRYICKYDSIGNTLFTALLDFNSNGNPQMGVDSKGNIIAVCLEYKLYDPYTNKPETDTRLFCQVTSPDGNISPLLPIATFNKLYTAFELKGLYVTKNDHVLMNGKMSIKPVEIKDDSNHKTFFSTAVNDRCVLLELDTTFHLIAINAFSDQNLHVFQPSCQIKNISTDIAENIIVAGKFGGYFDFDFSSSASRFINAQENSGFITSYSLKPVSEPSSINMEDMGYIDLATTYVDAIHNEVYYSNPSARMEIKDRVNYINTFNPDYKKAYSISSISSKNLYSGMMYCDFYSAENKPDRDGYYFGEMKDGLASGYGEYIEYNDLDALLLFGGKKMKGFWQQGKLVHMKEATQIMNEIVKAFDFGSVFGYENVAGIQSGIVSVQFLKDVFNASLVAQKLITFKVSWTESGLSHKMYVTYRHNLLRNTEDLSINGLDEASSVRYKKVKESIFWQEAAKALLQHISGNPEKNESVSGAWKNGSDNLIEKLIRLQQEKKNNKLSNPGKGRFTYSELYARCIKKCREVNSGQFDNRDSLSGIWIDREKDLILYIPSSKLGKIYVASLSPDSYVEDLNYDYFGPVELFWTPLANNIVTLQRKKYRISFINKNTVKIEGLWFLERLNGVENPIE